MIYNADAPYKLTPKPVETAFDKPRIFMSGGRWVAAHSVHRTEYSKSLVPIAEATTLQELMQKLKPRPKKFMQKLLERW